MTPTRTAKRQKLPLWRWDPFLAGLVLGLSLVAALFQRLDIPVVSPITLTVLLIVAVAATISMVLPVFLPSLRRDAEGSLRLRADAELLPVEMDDQLPVVDGGPHRTSVEAAFAKGGADLTAVLVPGATSWLGRDLRVAVDAVVKNQVYRLGYLPRESEQQISAVLAPLAKKNVFVNVPVSILNPAKPAKIRVRVGPSLGENGPLL